MSKYGRFLLPGALHQTRNFDANHDAAGIGVAERKLQLPVNLHNFFANDDAAGIGVAELKLQHNFFANDDAAGIGVAELKLQCLPVKLRPESDAIGADELRCFAGAQSFEENTADLWGGTQEFRAGSEFSLTQLQLQTVLFWISALALMDHAGVPQRRVPSLMDVTGVDEGPSDVLAARRMAGQELSNVLAARRMVGQELSNVSPSRRPAPDDVIFNGVELNADGTDHRFYEDRFHEFSTGPHWKEQSKLATGKNDLEKIKLKRCQPETEILGSVAFPEENTADLWGEWDPGIQGRMDHAGVPKSTDVCHLWVTDVTGVTGRMIQDEVCQQQHCEPRSLRRGSSEADGKGAVKRLQPFQAKPFNDRWIRWEMEGPTDDFG
ncbi:unnamed protein product [Cladocopium goreaui]|uniref:Uncharacterized protein n=1 Tax=Cladocopium goreaui TaxID=2562237 RepID=A0A9P1G935_9DINO|nr:unnamed protein product [Cladocopium goreaui]